MEMESAPLDRCERREHCEDGRWLITTTLMINKIKMKKIGMKMVMRKNILGATYRTTKRAFLFLSLSLSKVLAICKISKIPVPMLLAIRQTLKICKNALPKLRASVKAVMK